VILKFIFPGEPKAIQSMKVRGMGNYVHKYQPTKNTEWKAYIRMMALQQIPKGFTLWDSYVIIKRALFVFTQPKRLKSSEKKAIEQGHYVLKNTKPDLTDNLYKGLIDALTGIVYTDDARICMAEDISAKVYGQSPRIELIFEHRTNPIIFASDLGIKPKTNNPFELSFE